MIDAGAFYPYSPREHLRDALREYVPEYMLLAPQAPWRGDTKRWASELRARVRHLLGIPDSFAASHESPQPQCSRPLGPLPCPLDIRLHHAEQYHRYTAQKITYNTETGLTIPAILCVPDDLEAPVPAVICLHDRGQSKNDLVNAQADTVSFPHQAFARELAQNGYVTLAPDLRCFGECLADEAAIGALALLQGRPLTGLRVWDTIRAVDVLNTQPEVLGDRIGCVGSGLGGLVTLFAAAVDERLAAACVNGCLTTYQDTLLARDGSLVSGSGGTLPGSAFDPVPGLLQYADLYDIACLIAPRPLQMLQSTLAADYVEIAAERCGRLICQGYEALDEKIKAEVDTCDKPGFPGEQVYRFLDDWLKLGLH